MLRIMSDVSKELVDQVLTKTGWSHASAKLWNGPRGLVAENTKLAEVDLLNRN